MREPHPVTASAQASPEPTFRQVGFGPWEQTHPGEPRPDDPQSPDFDARFDTELLDLGDRRNVIDRYRYWSVEAIREDLDARGRHGFEIAVENWTHDFNIGSMVRSANAFGARCVYIVGPHKWNRKGSLMTELYQHVEHRPTIRSLIEDWRAALREEMQATELAADRTSLQADRVRFQQAACSARDAKVIALDIVPGAVPMEVYRFPDRCLFLFGAEGPGLSQEALDLADKVVYISQFGSVRSLNAGAAAAVTMHEWVRQHISQ